MWPTPQVKWSTSNIMWPIWVGLVPPSCTASWLDVSIPRQSGAESRQHSAVKGQILSTSTSSTRWLTHTHTHVHTHMHINHSFLKLLCSRYFNFHACIHTLTLHICTHTNLHVHNYYANICLSGSHCISIPRSVVCEGSSTDLHCWSTLLWWPHSLHPHTLHREHSPSSTQPHSSCSDWLLLP